MKVRKEQRKGAIAIVTIITLIFIGGCASKVKIRASDMMLKENRVKKIAVLAEGKINWPRMGKGGQVLGVSDSKKALREHISKTKQILTNKGYEVVFAEPVGIGYYCKKWWLMPERYGEDESCQLQLIEDSKPVFTYPKFQDSQEFSKAVHNINEQLELALVEKRLDSFVPSKKDIEVIQQATEADTICLNRIYGVKFSTRRKAGAFALGVVAGMFGAYGHGHISDMVESYFVFIDATRGDVLWQHGIYTQGEPIEPSEKFLENVLKFFPARNEPFDQKACAKGKDGFVYCK